MPGMSGLDLQRLLVARDRRVPVIMITARGDPGLEARAAAGGAVCLLRKPFGADTLIGYLEKALQV
jgi:FixJ family two-component response regulator